MDCSLPGSRPWDSPGKDTAVGCHAFLQGNLPDPGIEPASLTSHPLTGRFFTTSPPPGKPFHLYKVSLKDNWDVPGGLVVKTTLPMQGALIPLLVGD